MSETEALIQELQRIDARRGADDARRVEIMRQLAVSGMSLRQIGALVGITGQAVFQLIRKKPSPAETRRS